MLRKGGLRGGQNPESIPAPAGILTYRIRQIPLHLSLSLLLSFPPSVFLFPSLPSSLPPPPPPHSSSLSLLLILAQSSLSLVFVSCTKIVPPKYPDGISTSCACPSPLPPSTLRKAAALVLWRLPNHPNLQPLLSLIV